MKILKFKPPTYFHWKDDVDRIVAICAAHGYHISEADAQHAWEEHSDAFAASWLILGKDEDVLKIVLRYCEVTEYGNV